MVDGMATRVSCRVVRFGACCVAAYFSQVFCFHLVVCDFTSVPVPASGASVVIYRTTNSVNRDVCLSIELDNFDSTGTNASAGPRKAIDVHLDDHSHCVLRLRV